MESFDGSTDVERLIDRVELAMRIDEVPVEKSGPLLAMKLEGAAYDTWKRMDPAEQVDCSKIECELRIVFGLGKFQTWMRLMEAPPILPGDHVDVAFAEDDKLFKTVSSTDNDTNILGRLQACHFASRLPLDVQNQVLLRCGRDMDPTAVVACAKELLQKKPFDVPALAATTATSKSSVRNSRAPSVINDVTETSSYGDSQLKQRISRLESP